jgi:hypothetical protein
MGLKNHSGSCCGTSKPAAAPKKMSAEELHACITKKAKELWEKKGKPVGKDKEIWIEAEKAVKGSCCC